MSPRFIFHIGLHKTGTSYLQRSYLKRLKSVTLFNYVMDFPSFGNRNMDNKHILISNEGLSGVAWNYKWLRGIKNEYSWMSSFETAVQNTRLIFNNGEVIIFLRNHGDLLLSMYKQYIQEGGILKLNDFYGEEGVIKPSDLLFTPRIKFLQKNFTQVYVLSYDEFKKEGDIYLNNFFRSIGIDVNSEKSAITIENKSISGKKIELMRKFNIVFPRLPKIIRKICERFHFKPRDIFQIRLKNWNTPDSEDLVEFKNRVNEQFNEDFLKCEKYFLSYSNNKVIH